MNKYHEALELTQSCMISRYKGEKFIYILNIHKQVPSEDSDANPCLGPKFHQVPSEDTGYKADVPVAQNC